MLAYTIAAEIGDIERFASPGKLAGYSGLCPRVYQSGERDLRGALSKQEPPRYLRWALVEAATTPAPTRPTATVENYTHRPPKYIDRTDCREDGIWDISPHRPSPPWHNLTSRSVDGPRHSRRGAKSDAQPSAT